MEFRPTLNTNAAWEFFMREIGNEYGVAALIAGLYFMSGMETGLGKENYEIALEKREDKDARKAFIFEKFQFGIGGWKNWIRKQSLWNFAGKTAENLMNLDMQMRFVMDEFSGTTYGQVLEVLKTTDNVDKAVTSVAIGYLDLNRKQRAEVTVINDIAKIIHDSYICIRKVIFSPVKYVKAENIGVKVFSDIPRGMKRFRKKLGVMDPYDTYSYVETSEDGKWFRIRYEDNFGYVSADKTYIITKMEET